jgi:hypothetical protein
MLRQPVIFEAKMLAAAEKKYFTRDLATRRQAKTRAGKYLGAITVWTSVLTRSEARAGTGRARCEFVGFADAPPRRAP